METKHNIRLTSAEMGSLWTQYMYDSVVSCVLKHFKEKVEDSEIKPIIEYGLSNSQKHLGVIADIFTHENQPVPIGFRDEDVNVNAPRLFSDAFMLYYIKFLATLQMAANGVAVSMVARSDASDFFLETLASASELHDKTRKVLLSKGIYVRPPYITTSKQVDFVKKQNFLTGFFGQRRALHAVEISHLFANFMSNSVGKLLMTGFAQVAKSNEVRDYLLRGKHIANKHMEVFSSILVEDDLPAPMSWDSHVMDVTDSPFSDKLMMFHTTALIAVGIGNYGTAIAASTRRDLGMHYARLVQEVGLFAEDGANLLINNGWMEEPPQSTLREVLAKKKSQNTD